MSGLSKDGASQVLERRIEDVEKEIVSITSRAETQRTCFVLCGSPAFDSVADAALHSLQLLPVSMLK